MNKNLTFIIIILIICYLIYYQKKIKINEKFSNNKRLSTRQEAIRKKIKIEDERKKRKEINDILINNYNNFKETNKYLRYIQNNNNLSDELMTKIKHVFETEFQDESNKLNAEKNDIYDKRYVYNKNRERAKKMNFIVKIVLYLLIVIIFIISIIKYFTVDFNTLD